VSTEVIDAHVFLRFPIEVLNASLDQIIHAQNAFLPVYEHPDANAGRPSPFFTSTLTNAAESEAYGVEADVLWRPVQAFTINASLAWLHSEFTKFFSKDPLDPKLFGPGGSSVPDSDLSGNATRMSPRWSFNINPTYQFELGNGGSVSLSSNLAYKSKQYHTEFNDDRLSQDGYIMLDANILYEAPDGHLTANLWVKNLTDELVYAGSFSVSTSRTIGGTLMPPRTFGITVGYAF